MEVDIRSFTWCCVQEKSRGIEIKKEDKAFILDFYKYSFAGNLMHWIDGSMQEDYHLLAEKLEGMYR